jgi:hypothetical protein
VPPERRTDEFVDASFVGRGLVRAVREDVRYQGAEGGAGGELSGKDQREQVVLQLRLGGVRGDSVTKLGGESPAAAAEPGSGEFGECGDRGALRAGPAAGHPPAGVRGLVHVCEGDAQQVAVDEVAATAVVEDAAGG